MSETKTIRVREDVHARFSRLANSFKEQTPMYADGMQDALVAMMDLWEHQTKTFGLAPLWKARDYLTSDTKGVAV